MENSHFAPYATRPESSRGRRFASEESRTRSAFQRDRDRILHAGAFRKLQYKTQVFVVHEGDYYRTRLTHSLEVAQIARSIARALGLDEDLAEACGPAHDLGHPPFAHAGEDALQSVMEPFGGFDHNEQTFRILTELEQRYAAFDGLNLTWETLEGVVKHNGPLVGEGCKPLRPFIAAFDRDWPLSLSSHPSAEAQVAALSDDIAYNSHDVDDGLRSGLITEEQLSGVPLVGKLFEEVRALYPDCETQRRRYEVIRRMITHMVDDLIEETQRRAEAHRVTVVEDIRRLGRPLVAFSEEMQEMDAGLRGFLRSELYRHHRVNRTRRKARRIVTDLFECYLAEPECLPKDWRGQAESEGDLTARARLVTDYIAGMTDSYAMKEHSRLFDLKALSEI